MITVENMSVAGTTDAELVAASLAGDRNAFGHIVSRYQALVCSLAYSATGSLTQSEDLAQETFLRAWKELSQLREPSKLRPWLCTIARFLISKTRRRDQREPIHHAQDLDAIGESPAVEPLPPARAISKEEEAILWRLLERIPENYREPLVLFYREHQSIENVAQTLELSEDAVKQRLSRGRKLLHAEVLAFVEGTLERTNPGPTFTLGVLAALPLVAPSADAATVGTVALAGKGSGAAKGAGLLGSVGFAGMIGAAFAGQIAALWGRARSGRSSRERQFLARTSWGVIAWKFMFAVAFVILLAFSGDKIVINSLSDATRWMVLWSVALALWIAYSAWMHRKHAQIQLQEGTVSAADSRALARPAAAGLAARAYGGFAGSIFGTGGLFIWLLQHQGNRLTAALMFVLAIVTWLVSARYVIRHPETFRRAFFGVWWGQAVVVLVTLNLHFAPLFVTILVAFFYASTAAAWWLPKRLARWPKRIA